MQSVVPDIFDNHSLAPNNKLRDNLDYGPLEGESINSRAAYPCLRIHNPVVMRRVSYKRTSVVTNRESAFKLNLYLIQIAKGNEEYAMM